jgi:sialic acid synthase SpsE
MVTDAVKPPAMTTIFIGDRKIGLGKPTYIIAEIGSNHNGSLQTARKLVQLSAEAGADAVKFQAYSRETLFSPRLPEDGNEEIKDRNKILSRRWDFLPRYSAADEWWPELKTLCDQIGIDFIVTPFDLERLKLLDQLDVKAHKIASGDITWMELLKAAGATGKPVILSTGASSLNEVARALEAILCAFTSN